MKKIFAVLAIAASTLVSAEASAQHRGAQPRCEPGSYLVRDQGRPMCRRDNVGGGARHIGTQIHRGQPFCRSGGRLVNHPETGQPACFDGYRHHGGGQQMGVERAVHRTEVADYQATVPEVRHVERRVEVPVYRSAPRYYRAAPRYRVHRSVRRSARVVERVVVREHASVEALRLEVERLRLEMSAARAAGHVTVTQTVGATATPVALAPSAVAAPSTVVVPTPSVSVVPRAAAPSIVSTSVVRTIEAGRIYELPDNDGRINRCQVKETLPLTGNLSRHFTAIYRCDDDRSRSVLIHVNTRGFVGHAPSLAVIETFVGQM